MKLNGLPVEILGENQYKFVKVTNLNYFCRLIKYIPTV